MSRVFEGEIAKVDLGLVGFAAVALAFAPECGESDSGGNPPRGLTPTDRKVAAEVWKMIIVGDLEGAINHIISSYPGIFYLNKNITWIISAQGRGNINTTDSRSRQVWSDGPNGKKLLLIGSDFGRKIMHRFVAGRLDYVTLVRGVFHEYVHVLNAFSAFGKMEDNEDEFRAHYASITNPFLPAYNPDYMRFYISTAEDYYNKIPGQNKTPELQKMYGELENNVKPKYYSP